MTAKRILVLGATGATGNQVVRQAIEQGHVVTVFVRNPDRLASKPDSVRVLVGDVTGSGNALTAAVRNQDAVISALGLGKSLKANGLIARSVPAITDAMGAEGVRRLIFLSAFGVGPTYTDTPLLPRFLTRTLLKDMYADKNLGDEELRGIGDSIDWTIVYPTALTNDARTGHYRTGERLRLRGFPKISRADVAEFMLKQLDDITYLRKGVLLSA
jgi:putative NADH-flavin reductase